MSSLPPPDPIRQRPSWALPVLMPGQLTPYWRYALSGLWVAVAATFVAISFTAEFIGKPPWWGRTVWSVLPFGVSMGVALVAWANSRWSGLVGIVGALGLGGIALADVDNAPGAAAATGILAAGALLATLATFAGRVRRPQGTADAAAPS